MYGLEGRDVGLYHVQSSAPSNTPRMLQPLSFTLLFLPGGLF